MAQEFERVEIFKSLEKNYSEFESLRPDKRKERGVLLVAILEDVNALIDNNRKY